MRTLNQEFILWTAQLTRAPEGPCEQFLNDMYPIEFLWYLERNGLYRYYSQLAWNYLHSEKKILENKLDAAYANFAVLNEQLYKQAELLQKS